MNKASGGDGIPVELFQILKDDVKVLHSICQENSAVTTGLEKVSHIAGGFFTNICHIFIFSHCGCVRSVFLWIKSLKNNG